MEKGADRASILRPMLIPDIASGMIAIITEREARTPAPSPLVQPVPTLLGMPSALWPEAVPM